MKFIEGLRVALWAIQANKLRSALTLLGVIIGVVTIIAMQSIVGGLQKSVVSQLQILGSDVFQVQKYPPIQMGGRALRKYRNRKNLTREQAEAIRRYATAVKSVGAEEEKWGVALRHRDRKTLPTVLVYGTTPEFQVNYGYFVDEGRFLTETDVDHNRQVVVLGKDVIDRLFPFESPIGQEVKISGWSFRVIGTFEEKGRIFGSSRDNVAVIPISTFEKLYGKKRSVGISVMARSPELYQEAVDQVIGILRAVRKVKPGEPNDFEVFSSQTLVQTFNNLTLYVRLAAIGIAAISLVVAGVGIMNIMLVSVTERTREIGIRKAVGARRRDIMLQFLLEAVALTEVGGAVGIVAGIAVAQFVAAVSPLPASFPIVWVFVGLLFCSVVGVVFGVYPATKAARLDPIESLRYE